MTGESKISNALGLFCLFILASAGLGLVTYAMKGRPQFDDAGFIFSVLGYYITIFGFWMTIVASRKAVEIAQSLREKIAAIDGVADITNALAIIGELRRLQNTTSWIQIPERYSALRHVLVRVRETSATLSPNQKKVIQEAIKTTTQIEMKIHAGLRSGATPPFSQIDHSKADAFLAEQADQLNVLSIQITKEAKKNG